MSDTQTVINTRPQYVQDIDQALLARIFGTPDENGVLTGGLIDDTTLFNIPDYVQGTDTSGMQAAVAATLGTPEGRQDFIDRYLPYFQDAEGNVRYVPEAGTALGAGEDVIEKALADYFPNAATYLKKGRGSVDTGSIYDEALTGVSDKIDQGTQTFNAKNRANALLGGAKTAIQGGIGQYAPEGVTEGGTFEPADIDAGGTFGAKDVFDTRTSRAGELIEAGLGGFDPTSATSFMDPYKEQVVDAALQKIEREGGKRRQSDAAKAISSGAFGGSRAAVQAAETERAIEEAKQQTVANLMSQGYDKAMANAMAADEAQRKRALEASGLSGDIASKGTMLEQQAYEDAAKRGLAAATTQGEMEQQAYEDAARRALAASTTESQMGQDAYEDAMKRQLAAGQELGRLGLGQLTAETGAFESGEDRMLKAADMYRSIGLSEAEATAKAEEDEYKRSLEAGRLMGGLGQTYGQLGAAQADIGQAYGQLAGTSADIGRVYAGMTPADLSFMYELGGKERMYDQQYQDFLRANTLAGTQQALAPYSYGQAFLTQSPSASMYSQYTQTPQTQANPFLQGVGMYTTMQGLNQS